MEGLHPVASKQEVSIDVKVATVVALNLDPECFPDLRLIEPLADVSELGVAEVAAVFALSSDVVDVLPRTLIRTHHSIVAVD